MIVLTGPTAVGKSDLALTLANNIGGEIINADVGQFYTPLTIGTAKPDWQSLKIPHHLFDILTAPLDYTVSQFRSQVIKTIQSVEARNAIPLIVGGSSFYIGSLFFPPKAGKKNSEMSHIQFETEDPQALWQLLNTIDPERAQTIHPNDIYRIKRALSIWYETGKKPSHYMPEYNPPQDFLLCIITRNRDELYERINERTKIMIQEGWLDEVRPLLGTPWEQFLLRKKIIGYDDIILYLKGEFEGTQQDLINKIAQKTRNYAKRQILFLKMLHNRIKQYIEHEKQRSRVIEVNLTNVNLELYINQLSNEMLSWIEKNL